MEFSLSPIIFISISYQKYLYKRSDHQPQNILAEGDVDKILCLKNRGFEAYFAKTLKPLFLLPQFFI
ncbi:hypothetical protein BV378_21190 [Nostoc sp. RF31YmG]|nr:hypothetical protein BV378_21190 [Nostoc sp. RF31YmG]